MGIMLGHRGMCLGWCWGTWGWGVNGIGAHGDLVGMVLRLHKDWVGMVLGHMWMR